MLYMKAVLIKNVEGCLQGLTDQIYVFRTYLGR